MSEQTMQGTALAPAAQAEIESIRRQGAAEVARRQEVGKLYKMLDGLEWGSGNQVVRGSSFSPAVRQAFAEFCFAARANPMYHVDVLGGKPYLNEKYWSDRINADPQFFDFEYTNISRDPGGREEWDVPEWATHAYVCTIRKLANFAPIERIRSGEIADFHQYLVPVREANWAGGRPRKEKSAGGTYDADPIGNAEPSKTARTRALRRCAAKAFPVWCAEEEDRIRKLERTVEVGWSEVRTDQRAAASALPREDQPVALAVGAGEPVAASAPPRQPEPIDARQQPARRARQMREEAEQATPSRPDEEQVNRALVAMDAAGADTVESFAQAHLGRQPETTDDWRVLELAANALLDSDGAEPGL